MIKMKGILEMSPLRGFVDLLFPVRNVSPLRGFVDLLFPVRNVSPLRGFVDLLFPFRNVLPLRGCHLKRLIEFQSSKNKLNQLNLIKL